MAEDYLRVLDLSSEQPHRPIVSKTSFSHPTTASSSLPVSLVVTPELYCGGFRLVDNLNELLTPDINKLMSSPSSQGLEKPITPTVGGFSKRPIETLSSNKEINQRSSGIIVHPTNARRRIHQQNVDSPESILNTYSQWDTYRQSSESLDSKDTHNASPTVLRRHASLKRTDFTNREELQKYKNGHKFIFHRGFFKRNTSNINTTLKRTKKLRSEAEYNAVLRYTDLSSFPTVDVISSDVVRVYRPGNILARSPKVKQALTIPLREYERCVTRKNSIRRPVPPIRPHILHKPTTPKSSKFGPTIRRSNTTPPAIQNIRQRSYSPERRVVHDLWKEYISLVVAQRIQLRMSLMNSNDNESCDSVSAKLFSENTRKPQSVVSDDHETTQVHNDSAISLITAGSSSRISAKRKAY